jgi:hypothetical protein
LLIYARDHRSTSETGTLIFIYPFEGRPLLEDSGDESLTCGKTGSMQESGGGQIELTEILKHIDRRKEHE